jgi:UPF0755 protein
MLKVIFLSTLAVLLLALGCAGFYITSGFPNAPLSQGTASIIVNLPKGGGSKAIISQLRFHGLLTPTQARLLQMWIRWQHLDRSLQAGEYAFAFNSTPQALVQKMIRGDVVQYAFTLNEGITFADALQLLQKHPAIKKTLVNPSPEEMMRLVGEPGIPGEGLFFPDTYYFPRDFTDVALFRRARLRMQTQLASAWAKRAPNNELKTPYEALVLASIIEKETASDPERTIIAGVLLRRISQNMRLQVDPSVIYGIKKEFTGRLTLSQLKQDTPYNTYLYKGLPPTPIALPGLKSIEAALHPQAGNALYFVAKGDGTHHFSSTLVEHNEAVKKYQLRQPT